MDTTRTYYIPFTIVSTSTLRRLTPPAVKVWMALLAHDGPNGVYPSYPTLAAECDLDERTVESAVANLEMVGVVAVSRQLGKPNRYTFLPPSSNAPTPDAPTSHVGGVPSSHGGGTTLIPCVQPPSSHGGLTLSRNTKHEHQAVTPSNSGPSALGGHSPAIPAESTSPAPENTTTPSPAENIQGQPVNPASTPPASQNHVQHLNPVPTSHAESTSQQVTPAGDQQVPTCGMVPSPAAVVSSNTLAPAGTGTVTAPADMEAVQSTSKVTTVKPVRPARSARVLSDEDKTAIRQSAYTIAAYYLFGMPAVGKSPAMWAGLAPSVTNWAPSRESWAPTGQRILPESGVGLPALAAYAWYRFSFARQALKLPIGLPAFGKLLGVVKALRARMTQEEVVGHIDRIANNWPAIQSALGTWGAGLALDEGTLGIPQVIAQSDKLAAGQSLTPAASFGRFPVSTCNIDFSGREKVYGGSNE